MISLLNAIRAIFSVESFVPHGHCYLWKTGLVGLHVTADALIALAYYSIPIALFYFVRQRQDLPFKSVFLLFAAFIISCGTTHILEIWTLWYPAYWLSGIVKATTALFSVFTAIELVSIMPKILALPSPAELQRLNEELQISETRFAGILEFASDAIISITPDQRITLFNRTAETVFGYAADEALGQPLGLLLPQCSTALQDQNIGNAREISGRRKDGSEFPVEAAISRLEVAGEEIFTAFLCDISERKQAEADLQEQQQFLRQIIDINPNLIFVKDRDGKFTLVNQAVAEIYGTTVEALIGKTDADFCLNLAEAEHYRQADQQVMQTLQPLLNLEETCTDANGIVHHLQTNKKLLISPNGTQYVLGVANDITTLKQTEVALQQKTEELEAFFLSSIDLLCIANTAGRWLRLNPEWECTLGYSWQALEGQNFLDFVHPDDREATFTAMSQLSEQRPIPGFVNRYRHQNGSYRWLEWRSISKGSYIYATARDITERRASEEALKVSEAQFRSAFDYSAIGMALVDLDGHWLKVNAALCEIVGYCQDELATLTFQDITYPDDLATDLAYLQQLLSGEIRYYQMEKRYIHKQGQIVWILLTGTLLRNSQNEPLYFLGQIQNITYRKQSEEKLQQSENTKRAMIQAIPDLLISMKRDGTQTELINRGCVHLIGGEATFQKSNVGNILPCNVVRERLRCAEQALETGEVQFHEYQLTIDGEYYYEEARVVSLQADEVLVMVRDITDRKQMEQALRESETRFRTLIEDLQVGVIVYGTRAEVLLSNSKALDLLGLTEAQVLGKTSFDPDWNVIHEDGSPFSSQEHPSVQAIMTGRSVRNVIMGVYHPRLNDHIWLLVDAEPRLDEHGLLQQVICTFSDISDRQAALRERERAKLELQQREQEFRALVENAPDIIMRFDHTCRYLYINPTVERHTGIPASILINRTIEEFNIPTSLTKLWRANIHRAFETRQEQELEFEVPTGAGIVYYAARVVPEFASDGSVQSVLAVARDISDYIYTLQERERVEERLQRYKQIVAATTDGIALINRNYTYQVANQAYLNWYQKRKDQIIGHTVIELLGVQQFTAVKVHLDRCLTGETIRYEQWVDCPQLGRQFVSITYAPYLEPDQSIVGVVVSLRNLTELQRAEAQLRQSEERLRLALKAAKFGTWEYDFVTDELFQSNISEIYGLQPGQIHTTQAEWQAQVHPDDREWVQAEFDRAIREGGEFYGEFRIVRPDGTVRWVLSSGTVAQNEDGQPLHAYGVTADITDRKLAEVEEKAQKIFLRQVIDTVPNIIFVKNKSGEILIVNQAGADAHGTTVEAMLGKREVDFNPNFSPEQLQEFLTINQRVIQTRQPHVDLSQIIVSATGETHWYQTVINPLMDVNGEGIGIVGATTDVTNLKRIEQALQQAKEAAEAANKAKSIFLANMSHEFRTPLNVILGFVQVMQRDSLLTSEQQENLQIIRRSGDHLLSLINDVLDLSKIEAGYITLDGSNIDLVDVMQSLEQMFRQRADVKGLQLHLELISNLPQYITVDVNKLRQVLINLLSNAIKFTQQGSVTLRVSSAERQNERTLAGQQQLPHERQVALTFTVIDTGIGIDLAELETIFSAFVQTHAGKISPEGTGLGLTISRKFVQIMGGDITVQSTLGQGSTFAFTIPVCLAESADVIPLSGGQVIGLAPGQPAYRILVVDDQPENRKLLVTLLTQIGLEVREAINGQEAVTQWQQWQPHLIYMDMRMPLLNGREATQQIRATPNGHTPIIIALTAQASRSDRTLALTSGCNDYLSKPFQEEVLLSKMAEHLGLTYLYATDQSTAEGESSNGSVSLHPSDLSRMPLEWITALQQTAWLCDDSGIEALIEQIPPDQIFLIQGLRQLTQNYKFQQIISLTQPKMKNEMLEGMPTHNLE